MNKKGNNTNKIYYTHDKSLILLIQQNTQGTQNRSQPKVLGRNRIDKNRHKFKLLVDKMNLEKAPQKELFHNDIKFANLNYC